MISYCGTRYQSYSGRKEYHLDNNSYYNLDTDVILFRLLNNVNIKLFHADEDERLRTQFPPNIYID